MVMGYFGELDDDGKLIEGDDETTPGKFVIEPINIIEKTIQDKRESLISRRLFVRNRIDQLEGYFKQIKSIVSSISKLLNITNSNEFRVDDTYYSLEFLVHTRHKRLKRSDDFYVDGTSTSPEHLHHFFKARSSYLETELENLKLESIELNNNISMLDEEYKKYINDNITVKRIMASNSSCKLGNEILDKYDVQITNLNKINRFDRHSDYKWVRLGVGCICLTFIAIALYIGV